MEVVKDLYVRKHKELKPCKWRPSDQFLEAIESANETFRCECDRAYIVRAALKTYRKLNFEFTPTNKKSEKGSNLPITLEIRDSIDFTNQEMDVKLTNEDVEGISIAYINLKIREMKR